MEEEARGTATVPNAAAGIAPSLSPAGERPRPLPGPATGLPVRQSTPEILCVHCILPAGIRKDHTRIAGEDQGGRRQPGQRCGHPAAPRGGVCAQEDSYCRGEKGGGGPYQNRFGKRFPGPICRSGAKDQGQEADRAHFLPLLFSMLLGRLLPKVQVCPSLRRHSVCRCPIPTG